MKTGPMTLPMTRRNLIITGGINHDFDDSTAAVSEVLEGAGFESSICTDIDAAFDMINQHQYDLVTLNTLRWRMLDDDKYIPDRKQWAYEIGSRERQILGAHLREGGGLLGLHTAAICFDTWDEWPDLLGAKWIWGKSFHPPPNTIHVSNVNPHHPTTHGLGDFDIVDEIYHYIRPAPNAEPLFSTTSPEDGSEQTLAWAQQVGAGRAIYDSLGHDRASVTVQGHAQFLQNAALWCCGQNPGS
jgi:type 1 glutamine amidotransferase